MGYLVDLGKDVAVLVNFGSERNVRLAGQFQMLSWVGRSWRMILVAVARIRGSFLFPVERSTRAVGIAMLMQDLMPHSLYRLAVEVLSAGSNTQRETSWRLCNNV